MPFIARYRRDSIGGCSEEARFFSVITCSRADAVDCTQALRDVAKSFEAVEKLNKLKVKTVIALRAVPSLPDHVLASVVAAADAEDVKEIAGQFISKAFAPSPTLSPASDVCSSGEGGVVACLPSAGRAWRSSSSSLAHGPSAPMDIYRFWGPAHEDGTQRQIFARVDCDCPG